VTACGPVNINIVGKTRPLRNSEINSKELIPWSDIN
jgi:hypothetical protein